ncbi:MAG TPA: VOC family protein [Xanthobacteraceae bacterium]|nr:VOC family protein [Xanthobacteraceae bacterium]
MARGLDHIVHAVRDLDAAAATYGRLGFTIGARNRHPWGTHNRIIQLPGFFIELLTVAEPDKLGPDGFARLFGGFNRDFLARHEGFSLLMLESHDAARDADLLRDAGIAASQALRFERQGERPDGTPVTLGFSLAFARDAAAPGAGFAISQQHFPENFWNPAFQAHPNTASGVAGVVLVAENPSVHHIFLSAFAGERELLATSTGITVTTPRGTIQVMDPSAYRRHFGVAPPETGEGARLAAVIVSVRDMAAAAAGLAKADVPAAKLMGRLVVGPQAAIGATIVFETG